MNAPEHFDEKAKAYFYFIVNELGKVDKLYGPDKPIIERLAFNLSVVEKCEQILLDEGFVIDGLHGKKEHPAMSVMMKAQSKIFECFKLFGLDATSKFKVEKGKLPDLESDPLLRIIRGI